MYSCPKCGNESVVGQTVCACGADLSALQQMNALPDVWFNQGLKCEHEGRLGEAVEWFAACCCARPTDAECRRVLSKLWFRMGHKGNAIRCIQRAIELDFEHSGSKLLLAYYQRESVAPVLDTVQAGNGLRPESYDNDADSDGLRIRSTEEHHE